MPDLFKGRFLFPPYTEATEDGLLAYGGDLEPDTLLSAYSQGIFPWYEENSPVLWWFTNPRCVLYPQDFHISSRSSRKIRNSGFEYSYDQAFEKVIKSCAAPRKKESGTWILPEMQTAYIRLHRLGYAHSVEIWSNNELAGGLYGVSIGGVFFGESMFHNIAEASRAALLCLVTLLREYHFVMIDCQQVSRHMLAMGAVTVSGKVFKEKLESALFLPGRGPGLWPKTARVDGLTYHQSVETQR